MQQFTPEICLSTYTHRYYNAFEQLCRHLESIHSLFRTLGVSSLAFMEDAQHVSGLDFFLYLHHSEGCYRFYMCLLLGCICT